MSFAFSLKNLAIAGTILLKYPADKKLSAVLPLLHMAQAQNSNCISSDVIKYLAEFLDVSDTKIQEIVSFYSMFNDRPVGKYLVQVCGTTSCMLCGSEDIIKVCQDHLGIKKNETTKDGVFTLREVECLGACANAPVMQINNDYFENLNQERVIEVLDDLRYRAQNGSDVDSSY